MTSLHLVDDDRHLLGKCELPDEDFASNFGLPEIVTPETEGEAETTLELGGKVDQEVLMRAIDTCLRSDANQIFFGSWREKLMALVPAYCLLVMLVTLKGDGMSVFFRHPYISSLRRAPSRKNPALLAVRLITKPEWPDDHKIASDYAAMLLHAQQVGVAPEEFIEWASEKSLRDCRKAVAAARRAAKPRQEATRYEAIPSDQHGALTSGCRQSDGTEFALTITCHSTAAQTEHSIRFEGEQGRVQLRAPASNVVALPALLRRLAEALERSNFDGGEHA